MNLWEHTFTHPTSPIYQELLPLSGDYEVWGDLVPDFLSPAVFQRFAAYHERDLYDHNEFTRGVVNAGFSGLLWCPEIRDAQNGEDLIRRFQTVAFSPLAMVNAWYIKNPFLDGGQHGEITRATSPKTGERLNPPAAS